MNRKGTKKMRERLTPFITSKMSLIFLKAYFVTHFFLLPLPSCRVATRLMFCVTVEFSDAECTLTAIAALQGSVTQSVH